jgi:hypothetical protein
MPGISCTVVELAIGERDGGEECGPGFSISRISADGGNW